MKRYGNLYEKICDMDNLRLAHCNAKKGKGWYKEVRKVDENPDKYLKELHDLLVNKTYHTSEYEIFYKTENGKRRKVESGEMMNYSEWCSINSYKGWLKHCNSFRLSRKYIEPLKSYADAYYESQIKRSTKNEGLRKAEEYN